MKLYWAPTSPYVRKVMIVAHELTLADRIECGSIRVSMDEPNAELMTRNPLSKIPTLVFDDGTVLHDSRVICEYLDRLSSGPGLFPDALPARMIALRRQALGDGILDLLILWRYERARALEHQSQPLISSFDKKLRSALDAIEKQAPALEADAISIGHIAICCALCYLDFRFADRQWRDGRPLAAAWHAAFSERASVQATTFTDPRGR